MALTLAGTLLIAASLRDIFHTVFHPQGRGSLSALLQHAIWRAFRLVAGHRPSLLALAGPIAMIASVTAWAVLLALGWALILWPRLPGDVLLATGLEPADQNGFLDALYLSLVTLATLGYGDIVPRTDGLRVVATLEAFVGFTLITSAISWILSVYPVLGRRRFLAQEVSLLRETEAATMLHPLQLAPETSERLLAGFTARLIAIRGDVEQFPVTYYFHASDERSSLAAALPELARLAAEAAGADDSPAVRFHGTMLRRAIEEVAGELGASFLKRPGAPLDELLRAYAADHLRPTPRTAPR